MEKPRHVSSGDAMRWNADVERRRKAYHERRCSEDPVYKRAYERQQEMMLRIRKMNIMAMTQLQNAMSEAEHTKCQQAADQMNVDDEPKRVKSHEEVMRERAMLFDLREEYARGCDVLSAGMMAMLLGPEAEQRLKELDEEIPYAEEIRKADAEFDSEMIRLSGFEW